MARLAARPNPKASIRQAEAYKRLFQIFEKHTDAITRVTFWGLNDGRSWRRGQNPLIFDANNRRKPAYQSILDVVRKPINDRWLGHAHERPPTSAIAVIQFHEFGAENQQ